MRRWIGFVATVVAVSSPATQAGPDSASPLTPFHLSPAGGVVLTGDIDGHGPFRLLLDTGSTHSALTANAAAAVRAPVVARTPLTSGADIRLVPVVAIRRLTIGPVSVPLQPSVVAELPGREADGVIGQDVLAGRHFTIDYRRRVVEWHDEAGLVMASDAIRLEAVGGRFVVRARVGERQAPFVVDSASEALVLFHGAPSSASAAWPGVRGLLGLIGSASVRAGVVDRLSLGRVELARVEAVVLERPWKPGDPEGLLPTHAFGRVTIHGPARSLAVEPR